MSTLDYPTSNIQRNRHHIRRSSPLKQCHAVFDAWLLRPMIVIDPTAQQREMPAPSVRNLRSLFPTLREVHDAWEVAIGDNVHGGLGSSNHIFS
jgi:hypothetical protein